MADVAGDLDPEHDALLRRHYLVRFEEDTLRQRPLWIRLIIEFLGTFILVTVAAGPASSTITWAAGTWAAGRSAGPPR